MPTTEDKALLCLTEVAEAGGLDNTEKNFFWFIFDASWLGVLFSSAL